MNNKSSQIINFNLKKKYRQYWRRKIFRFYWSIFIISSLSFIFWWLWNTPLFAIQEIKVNGITKDSKNFITKTLNKQEILKQHFFHIDPLEVKTQLEDYPLIKNVQIKRWFFPMRLEIELVERQPWLKILHIEKTATFNEDNPIIPNESLVIDENGVILPIGLNPKAAYDILFASDIQYDTIPKKNNIIMAKISYVKLDIIRKILEYYETQQINEKGIFYIKNPQNIIFKKDNFIYWLGKLEDFSQKIKLIPETTKAAQPHIAELKYIDIRFLQAPVIKIQKGSSGTPAPSPEKQ